MSPCCLNPAHSSSAFHVTNETYRYLGDPRWHPSGDRVIATKYYTGQITVAAGEGWEYPVPHQEERVTVGAGKRVVERKLPLGWPPSMYNLNHIGPVQFLWAGEDKLIYSLNVANTDGLYHDGYDVHSGVNAIFQRDLSTGRTTQLVGATPGGASRPELSRDGRTLALVRRVRDKEALVLMCVVSLAYSSFPDPVTGTCKLDRCATSGTALHGTPPPAPLHLAHTQHLRSRRATMPS